MQIKKAAIAASIYSSWLVNDGLYVHRHDPNGLGHAWAHGLYGMRENDGGDDVSAHSCDSRYTPVPGGNRPPAAVRNIHVAHGNNVGLASQC